MTVKIWRSLSSMARRRREEPPGRPSRMQALLGAIPLGSAGHRASCGLQQHGGRSDLTENDAVIAQILADSERQSSIWRERTDNDAAMAASASDSPSAERRRRRAPPTLPACCADDAAIAACLAEELQASSGVEAAQPRPETRQLETCLACQDEPANACFIPCGHINVCMACARRVNPHRCPVCRLEFQAIVRTDAGR
mmetsp:Transcript_59137/g.183431  ORF Transcript_59137/g.183431 Transcript_59137/m.183431 type:complete len:198 (+) Transcript_59137:98-691(+)